MVVPGHRLRTLRESLHLTLRDVEALSYRIAAEHQWAEFAIPFSRLSAIEAKGVVPNIYRLYSLSAIYGIEFSELLQWYGVDLGSIPADLKLCDVPRTRKLEHDYHARTVRIPVEIDPSFNSQHTMNLTMLVRKWGSVPFAYLESLSREPFIHACVGTEDYTMAPLVPPGSFLQIDEARSTIENGGWRSEHERPIYFLETRRDGFRIGWCSLAGKILTVHPHPLSPTPLKSYIHPQEAEIVGQVVAVSMRLVPHSRMAADQDRKEQIEQASNVVYLHHRELGA
jgi:transcriptional regulator with XRE-family HTH domain